MKLPDAVDFVQAATATDAGQTAYGAVMGAGKLRAGERIGIIGLGGLGLTGARIAVLAGAQVYAADPKRETWSWPSSAACSRPLRTQGIWLGSIWT